MTAPGPVCVIGVGSLERGDDAAGLLVARRVREQLDHNVGVIESDGDITTLLDALSGCEVAIIVDAVRSNRLAGSVHRHNASEAPLPAQPMHYSTHAVNIPEAIELARALGALPTQVIVYGIEGERFDEGAALSSAVSRAIDQVVEQVALDVGNLGKVVLSDA